MQSNSEDNFAVPGSIDDLDFGSSHGSSSSKTSSEPVLDKGHPMVIGLFGSDDGDDLKNRFFNTLCGDGLSPKGSSSPLVQRGTFQGNLNDCSGNNIQIWKFPSLHNGTWLQRAEAFLCVAAHMERCVGRLHGAIYVQGIDDEEDTEAFQLFRSLMGDDGLLHSLILSESSIEFDNDTDGMELPKVLLSSVSRDACNDVIERLLEASVPMSSLFQLEISSGKSIGSTTAGLTFDARLEDAKQILDDALSHIHGKSVNPRPSAPLSPRSPPARRRPTSTELSNQLNGAQHQLRELRDSYDALERNSSERISKLEESNEELRSEKKEMEVKVDSLKDELDKLRLEAEQSHAETKEPGVQTDPPAEPRPTREELQNEVLEFKTLLAEAKMGEAKALGQVADLSEQLAREKLSLTETRKSDTELKKKAASLEKQVETLTKATEAKKEEVDKAKGETSKVNLQLKSAKDDLSKAQQHLKECTSNRAKLEDERAKAINVSEGLLKVKDGFEKQLGEAKSQIDTVQKRAKVEIGTLKEALAEKESQIRDIARAAEAWAFAPAEAKSLKEELQLHQDHADARERAMHGELSKMRVEHEQAREEWMVTETRLNASILSLTQRNEASREQLEAMSKQRDDEAEGYINRITELEWWGEERWDAIGNGCVIA